MIEIPTVDEIKVQIEELQEKLKIAYILDPKYRCSTCGGLRNVETQYFDLGHAPKIIRGGCPDCLGQGYNIGPEEKYSQSGQFEKMREELRMYRIFPGPMNRHYYGIDPFAPRHIVSLQLGTFYIKLLLDTLENNTPEWQWPELKRHLHYILTDYMIERENAMADLSMEEKDEPG